MSTVRPSGTTGTLVAHISGLPEFNPATLLDQGAITQRLPPSQCRILNGCSCGCSYRDLYGVHEEGCSSFLTWRRSQNKFAPQPKQVCITVQLKQMSRCGHRPISPLAAAARDPRHQRDDVLPGRHRQGRPLPRVTTCF